MTAICDHSLDGEHHWMTDSEHSTSEGRIIYQSCACGRRRVLRSHDLTTVVAAR
jgi:hypothetical protein